MKKRFLSILLTLCLIFTLLPLTAKAASTGTLYKNFSEITNSASFSDGQTYIFLTKQYSNTDAVTTLSGGNALLTMTASPNSGGTNLTSDGYTLMKYVEVSQAGTGFDSCPNGAITYSSSAWYYWCSGGGVHHVGPFYAFTYDTISFSGSDVVVTANRAFGSTDTVAKADLTVKVQGFTVSDYTITDSSVTASDRQYTVDVGGVAVNLTAGSIITYTSHTGSSTTAVKNDGETIYVPSSDGAYAGYIFKGWTLTNGSHVVNYAPGSAFEIDKSTTLYAVWDPTTSYMVTVDGTAQSVLSGATATEPATPTKATVTTADTKTAYTFSHWQTSDGSEWNFSTPVIESLTITSVFSSTVYYNVTVDGAAQWVKSDSAAIEPSTPIKATVTTADTKTVYAFDHWVCSGSDWNFSTPVTASLTITSAFASTVSYLVTFNKNSSTVQAMPAAQWVVKDGNVSEVSPLSTWTDVSSNIYYFNGWNTKADGTGSDWNFSASHVNKDILPLLTLYAQWTIIPTYTATYSKNVPAGFESFAALSSGNESKAADAKLTVPADPTRTGYTFDGWYLKNGGFTVPYNFYKTLSENGISSNFTVYADWNALKSTIRTATIGNGIYKEFYSATISATYNVIDSPSAYRNFALVNSSKLPDGLYLDSLSGEIYGIPTKIGNYSFTIAMYDDEGYLISNEVTYTISINASSLAADLNGSYTNSKTYGTDDAAFWSSLYVDFTSDINTPDPVFAANSNTATITYDYAKYFTVGNPSYKAIYAANSALVNSLSSYKYVDTFVFDVDRQSGENVGTYKMYLNSLTATDALSTNVKGNYTITLTAPFSSINGTHTGNYLFTIVKKPLAITTNDAYTKTYGVADPAYTLKQVTEGTLVNRTVTNFMGGTYAINDSICNANGTGVVKSQIGRVSGEDYGTYNLTHSYTVDGDGNKTYTEKVAVYDGTHSNANTTDNYTITVSGQLSITRKNITITATGTTKTYGDNDNIGAEATTLINETIDDINGNSTVIKDKLFGHLNRVAGETVGTYGIYVNHDYFDIQNTAQTSAWDNYNITNAENVGTLTINAKALIATANIPISAASETVSYTSFRSDSLVNREVGDVNLNETLIKDNLTAGSYKTAEETAATYKKTDSKVTEITPFSIGSSTANYLISDVVINVYTPMSSYTITVIQSDYGTVSPATTMASPGGSYTFNITPSTGYTIKELLVDGLSIGIVSSYTFTDVAADHTISAMFTKAICDGGDNCVSHKFTDVNTSLWYHEGVDYMIDNNLMFGISEDTFAPDATNTRGMIITILYRLDNQPATTGENLYDDVENDKWYTEAIIWASANNIMMGYGNNQFGPEDSITREQLAKILYSFAIYKGYDVSTTADLSAYIDNDKISSWALSAMQWANATGLITGTNDTTLDPTGYATRAQVASILMRFIEWSK